MPGIAIVGAQWGDEGKGKITDFLAPEAEFVVRYQGGANAGHTVTAKGQTFKLNLLPSGVLHDGTVSVLGDGMVIDADKFMEERRNLIAGGLTPDLRISDRAHLVLPHHKFVDGRKDFVGTTGRGIGPAYADRARRVGIRFGDLLDDGVLRERIERLLEAKPNSTRDAGWTSVDVAMESLAPTREALAPFVQDTGEQLRAVGNGHGGVHRMLTPAQPGQHLQRLLRVARLAEDVAVNDHDGVRPDDDRVRIGARQHRRLVPGEPFTMRHRCLTGPYGLIDIRRRDVVRDADQRQQFAPTGRLRRQNDARQRGSRGFHAG